MLIEHPSECHTHQLRQLWKIAFGDTDDFLDSFFTTAFSPNRCRCILDNDRIAAVLYWFDCSVENHKFAYIYAVATHPDFRNRGLCRMLMENTHALLADRDYAAAILVPQKESLRKMYAGMGYRDCGGLNTITCAAGEPAVPVRAIGPEEFAFLRRQLLPADSVIQEQENLAFLARQMQFYSGDGFLLAAYAENGTLHGMELLGDSASAPGIIKTLNCTDGSFRTPGSSIPFAMFHPLKETCPNPSYFGFAFD